MPENAVLSRWWPTNDAVSSKWWPTKSAVADYRLVFTMPLESVQVVRHRGTARERRDSYPEVWNVRCPIPLAKHFVVGHDLPTSCGWQLRSSVCKVSKPWLCFPKAMRAAAIPVAISRKLSTSRPVDFSEPESAWLLCCFFFVPTIHTYVVFFSELHSSGSCLFDNSCMLLSDVVLFRFFRSFSF